MMPIDDARLPDSALDALPVFPLPGVVLFPGTVLPLHVFEPRYREMLADCLTASRCMAMALVVGEREDVEAEPAFARVAGVGIIVRHEALPDGRSNILLQGRGRVALDELPSVAPYRRARARVLTEIDSPVSTLDRRGLHAAATALASAARKPDFELPPGLAPGATADLCAHALLADVQTRQRTLEELDVAARVRFVTAALAEQLGLMRRTSHARPD